MDSPADAPADRAALLSALGDAVRANQRSTDAVDELVGQLLGINRTDGRILDLVQQHGQMSAGRLAEAAGLTSGAMTVAVDRLERSGYARRVPDPTDRRRVLVEATQLTHDLTAELFGPLIADSQPLSDRYSDEELRLLLDFNLRAAEIQERHAERLRERLVREPHG